MKKWKSESRQVRDETTGRTLRQVTGAPCINHHPFFLSPAYDSVQRYLYFVSYRTGAPQVFAEDRENDCIVQVSDVSALNEWSVHPHEKFAYYIADGCALRTDVCTGITDILLTPAEASAFCGSGKINPGNNPLTPGTTAVSADGRYFAIRVVGPEGYSILILDVQNASWTKEYTGEMVSHMQFCPDDANLLFFAGPLTDRVWLLDTSTGKARRAFTRNAEAKQWITHESWIPGRRELSLVDWPRGILAVNIDTGAVRRITDSNAWHAICNDSGTLMVADTNFPDRGLLTFDPRRENALGKQLCRPEASSLGAHWAGPFPYDNGPISVYAPQHTHPHPRFSPDGKTVVFTSDKTGNAQIYEIELPTEWLDTKQGGN
jgi:oligogalacturonide lyase